MYEHPSESVRLPALNNEESRVIATIETKLHKHVDDDGEEAIQAIIDCVAAMNNIPKETLHAELVDLVDL